MYSELKRYLGGNAAIGIATSIMLLTTACSSAETPPDQPQPSESGSARLTPPDTDEPIKLPSKSVEVGIREDLKVRLGELCTQVISADKVSEAKLVPFVDVSSFDTNDKAPSDKAEYAVNFAPDAMVAVVFDQSKIQGLRKENCEAGQIAVFDNPKQMLQYQAGKHLDKKFIFVSILRPDYFGKPDPTFMELDWDYAGSTGGHAIGNSSGEPEDMFTFEDVEHTRNILALADLLKEN